MKKNVIKLNENAIKRIVAESVKKVLKENENRLFQELDSLLYKTMAYGQCCGKYEGDHGWDFYECWHEVGEELKGILTKYNLI